MHQVLFGSVLLISFLDGAGRWRCGDHPLEVTEIDLASGEGRVLADEARVMFAPGVLVDGRPFTHGRLSERKLRRALERMSAERTEPR
jgi:hypothetical protein